MNKTPRILVRLLAVTALAASAVVGSASSAQATIHAYPATGGTCVGTQIKRCLELRFDDVNNRFRARAEVTDTAGGHDYNVDMAWVDTDITYQSGDGVRSAEWERLETPLAYCTQGSTVSITFAAGFTWQNASTGAWDGETRVGAASFVCR
ncbi:hypothetical protein [Catenuloplanes atrovinosus]|uniref:Secreted protein n=1 Tax=Catenuloplanes atrovinosus TaxID=137266 RepID=A0AAE3YNG1_9ACTN|nr:hypothetical protein [Catenuloplanes atrovinosus]MDR7275611.1 hypothetical protein [Catenuloplanes atrovinosus]